MAQIRNVSTDTLELRYGGEVLGVAEPDGLIEIDDKVAKDLEFPESLWDVAKAPKSTKKGE